ncbi:hypothetical protein [Phaeospirillum tilakii]|uniref:Uncharacterized protein n=1 Tax=Phaeospirillum tilakii TaxID=741673 RepID=A0ABW5CCX4_9PROT
MRSFLLALTLVAGLLGLTAAPAQADRAAALAKAKAQAGVMDAEIDDRAILWLLVKNQDADWNKYARLMCQLMQPYEAMIFGVRVVDFTSRGRFRSPEEWTLLGSAKCG